MQNAKIFHSKYKKSPVKAVIMATSAGLQYEIIVFNAIERHITY